MEESGGSGCAIARATRKAAWQRAKLELASIPDFFICYKGSCSTIDETLTKVDKYNDLVKKFIESIEKII